MKTILITRAAGFIGSNLVKKYCQAHPNHNVVGVDNISVSHKVKAD